ncbi:MAG TPA: DMT family transporter [Burkholderiaceae bacterium]|jgi:drug/metabolite transporter (DMT)-like permease|nr:DMT family transporter [Burkholderiaceae bacterium]
MTAPTLPTIERPATFNVYLKLSLVAITWGGTFVAGRYLAGHLNPMVSASLRFMLASAALTIFLLLSGRGFVRLSAIQLARVVFLGFCGIFAYSVFFFRGLQEVSAARASLIVALNPAAMAVVSYLFYRERLSLLKSVGIALCFAGVALVVSGGDPNTLLASPTAARSWTGELLIFGCVLSWTAYSVFCKGIVQQVGPLHTVAYSVYAGTLMLTAFTALSGGFNLHDIRALPLPGWLGLAYLGLLGSAITYIWYYDAIQQIGATRSGVFIALNPFAAVLLGALLLGETLTVSTLLGGTVIVAGIIACNRPPASTCRASAGKC